MSTRNTFWRQGTGEVRTAGCLRFPAALIALIEAKRPAKQSMNSFLGDLVLKGLGETPLYWRKPTEAEDAVRRIMAGDELEAKLISYGPLQSGLRPPAVLTDIPSSESEEALEW